MDRLETYRPSGICSKQIIFTVNEDNVITSCRFIHGCSGNQQGISRLVTGMHIDEVIASLNGIQREVRYKIIFVLLRTYLSAFIKGIRYASI